MHLALLATDTLRFFLLRLFCCFLRLFLSANALLFLLFTADLRFLGVLLGLAKRFELELLFLLQLLLEEGFLTSAVFLGGIDLILTNDAV